MKKFSFLQHFNLKILLMRILINASAIVLVALILPEIYFINRSVLSVLLIGIMLGVINAVVKPILLFLTAQLLFATYGLLVILINTLSLYILAWLFPNSFAVDSFVWAIVGGLILGLASNALENFLGLPPPIVPDADVDLRRRIAEQSAPGLHNLVVSPTTMFTQNVETQSIQDVQAAQAALDLINTQLETNQPGEAGSAAEQPPTPGGEA